MDLLWIFRSDEGDDSAPVNSAHSLFPLFMRQPELSILWQKTDFKVAGWGAISSLKMFGLILASLPRRNCADTKPSPSCLRPGMPCVITNRLSRYFYFCSLVSSPPMLTFVVCVVCDSGLLSLRVSSEQALFLIVSSCSQCTLICPVQPGISSKQRGSPCPLISHEPHTHDWMCLCMCVQANRNVYSIMRVRVRNPQTLTDAHL